MAHLTLYQFFHSVNCERPQISGQREIGIEITSWIFDIMKGKILELIESFQSLVNDLFQSPRIGNATQLDEKVRSSTLLSIVILLIVIVARSQSRHV